MDTLTIYDINNIPHGSYGVLGCPIEHSLSPFIHNSLTEKENYYKIFIKPEDLIISLAIIKGRMQGFNVTIPHKIEIMDYLDEIDETARYYGAINTVKIKDNKLFGYNTDGEGFLKALNRANISIEGQNVLLAGAGGVARVMALEAVKHNSRLTIFCRNIDKGLTLKNRIANIYKDAQISVTDQAEPHQKYDVFLNGTPLGMYPDTDRMPIDAHYLDNIRAVFDTVYNPIETKLIKLAKSKGITAVNGLYMLSAQAAAARRIWTGIQYTDSVLDEVTKKLTGKLSIKGYNK